MPVIALLLCSPTGLASADTIAIANSGFEDTTGQSVFNEFTFGIPAGWEIYDPMDIHPSTGLTVGTLTPNGTDFFNSVAPEGTRVAIMYNTSRLGEGEYGLQQTLTDVLEANRDYTLTVEVGNIASGVATNGVFFDLDEFPGYRVELLAGGTVIAQDENLLTIPEAEWATSTVSFSTGASHALEGQALGIRLVNLNVIPAGFTAATSPDLEVDFDQVALQVNQSVPEPTTGLLFVWVALVAGCQRRRRLT